MSGGADESSPFGSIVDLDVKRTGLLAFEVRSKIVEEDMEWMARRVENAFRDESEIDIILLLTGYGGAEIGGVINAEVLKVQAKSAAHVRRYAVVGAPFWAKAMINLFSPLTPVEAKTFDLDQEQAAWAWVDDVAQIKG